MRLNRIIKYLFLLTAALSQPEAFSQASLSADQVLQKTKSAITAPKGIIADFSVTVSGSTGNGVLKTSGSKFIIALPDAKTWFNGTDLYTFNKRTNETTITNPTAEELTEVNPFEYVNNAGRQYNTGFSTTRLNGKYIIDLTPKNKNSEYKQIVLTINKSSFIPDKIEVKTKSGQNVVITVKSFKSVSAPQQKDFEYPASQYKNVEIIDLR